MSTSLLYHGFGVRGYRYLKTEYIGGEVVFSMELPREAYRCPACGSEHVIGRGQNPRRFRMVSIGEIEIRCAATDGNPLMEMFNAPRIRQCSCRLADLSTTLKEVWVARREVIARLEAGEAAPIFDGKWKWAIVFKDLP